MTDIEIAQAHEMKKIVDVAAKAGIDEKHLELYGNYKAKLDLSEIRKLPRKAKLILVTAISPTPAGEGKTTTSVGLADALNKLGKNTMVCLREPSLGPVFGVKGGAAGGGLFFAAVLSFVQTSLPREQCSSLLWHARAARPPLWAGCARAIVAGRCLSPENLPEVER